jgi:predicted O-methyltransferase YrrM
MFLVQKLNPKKIFEIGTLKGGTVFHFFHNTGSDVEITSLDITHSRLKDCTKNISSQNSRVKLIEHDSRTYDFSSLQGTIDFVFVDGGHAYEEVLSDSKNAFSLLSNQGTIVWDDYNSENTGVFAALNEIQKEKGNLFKIRGTSFVIYSNSKMLAFLTSSSLKQ